MKRADVQVGKVYAVKVSGKLAPVRITHERTTVAYGTYASASVYGSRYGRPKTMNKFMGVNERTGRTIGPFTAAKCRFEVMKNEFGKWRRVA